MGVTSGFRLGQFSEIFKIRNAAGQPYILIGGQAVNYWAEHYLASEPELRKLQPFTSEDIDAKGSPQSTLTFLEARPLTVVTHDVASRASNKSKAKRDQVS